MTLSAKQIIADLRIAAGILDTFHHKDLHDAIKKASAHLKEIQPRPIEKATKDEKVILLWLRDGAWDDAAVGIPPKRSICQPTHFIPLDALPLPEGE